MCKFINVACQHHYTYLDSQIQWKDSNEHLVYSLISLHGTQDHMSGDWMIVGIKPVRSLKMMEFR